MAEDWSSSQEKSRSRQLRDGGKQFAGVVVLGLLENPTGPVSTNWPARMTAMCVATCATTGKLWEMKM